MHERQPQQRREQGRPQPPEGGDRRAGAHRPAEDVGQSAGSQCERDQQEQTVSSPEQEKGACEVAAHSQGADHVDRAHSPIALEPEEPGQPR